MFVELYIYIYIYEQYNPETLWNRNIQFQLKKRNTYRNGIDNLVQQFYFVSYYFSWIEYDDFFFIFRRPIIIGWGRDMGTILRPIQISIWIYGWRWDRLVDPIKIGSTGSLTLRLKTCVRLVVSQPLRALHQYRASSLRSSWPWNNNMNDSWRIMDNSVKWSWTLDQWWMMIHVQLLFCRTVPGTTSLLQLRRYSSLILFLKHIKFVMNIWMNII